jgi:mono/diheme cytochrome c family protein
MRVAWMIAMLVGAAVSASAQDAANGKKLFATFGCYQCHGREGQGGAAGPKLAPKPLPQEALMKYVRNPSGQMPPYTTKVVKDAELADIYAFLRSIPDAQPAKNIPLLNQ